MPPPRRRWAPKWTSAQALATGFGGAITDGFDDDDGVAAEEQVAFAVAGVEFVAGCADAVAAAVFLDGLGGGGAQGLQDGVNAGDALPVLVGEGQGDEMAGGGGHSGLVVTGPGRVGEGA